MQQFSSNKTKYPNTFTMGTPAEGYDNQNRFPSPGGNKDFMSKKSDRNQMKTSVKKVDPTKIVVQMYR